MATLWQKKKKKKKNIRYKSGIIKVVLFTLLYTYNALQEKQ